MGSFSETYNDPIVLIRGAGELWEKKNSLSEPSAETSFSDTQVKHNLDTGKKNSPTAIIA